MRRREFLKAMAVLPVVGLPVQAERRTGSKQWYQGLSIGYTFNGSYPLFMATSQSFTEICVMRRMGPCYRLAEDKLHLHGLFYQIVQTQPGMKPLRAVFRNMGLTADGKSLCTEIEVFGVKSELPYVTFRHPCCGSSYRRYSCAVDIEFLDYDQDIKPCVFVANPTVSEAQLGKRA